VIARGAAAARGRAAALVATAALGGCASDPSPPAHPRPLAVLQVTVRGPGRVSEVATAFAVRDGRAVTVAHAIAGARSVSVTAPGRRRARARVLASDARLDLAVLAVRGLDVDAPRVASPTAGQRARVVVLRGNRARSLPAMVRRLITARVRDAPGATARVRPALELDTTVMQGDSGAPVLDAEGRLIGVLFAQSAQRDDRAYAVDARAMPSAAR
jgi:S1-C subfamily serine protease